MPCNASAARRWGMQQMTETLLWLSRESGELRDDGHIEVGRPAGGTARGTAALSQRRGLTFHLDVEPHTPAADPRTDHHRQPAAQRPAVQRRGRGGNRRARPQPADQQPHRRGPGTEESMAFGYGLGLDLVQRLCQKSGWAPALQQRRAALPLRAAVPRHTGLKRGGLPPHKKTRPGPRSWRGSARLSERTARPSWPAAWPG